jgi:hypothetical protein
MKAQVDLVSIFCFMKNFAGHLVGLPVDYSAILFRRVV